MLLTQPPSLPLPLPRTHQSGHCRCRRQSVGLCGPCRQLHRDPRHLPAAAALTPRRQREQVERVAVLARLQPQGIDGDARGPFQARHWQCLGEPVPPRCWPHGDCHDKALVLLRAQLRAHILGAQTTCLGIKHHRRISALRVRNLGAVEVPGVDSGPTPLPASGCTSIPAGHSRASCGLILTLLPGGSPLEWTEHRLCHTDQVPG